MNERRTCGEARACKYRGLLLRGPLACFVSCEVCSMVAVADLLWSPCVDVSIASIYVLARAAQLLGITCR